MTKRTPARLTIRPSWPSVLQLNGHAAPRPAVTTQHPTSRLAHTSPTETNTLAHPVYGITIAATHFPLLHDSPRLPLPQQGVIVPATT
ncbi:hypothetical protein FRC08_013469, partial [Ceratobasidium sp. 394]